MRQRQLDATATPQQKLVLKGQVKCSHPRVPRHHPDHAEARRPRAFGLHPLRSCPMVSLMVPAAACAHCWASSGAGRTLPGSLPAPRLPSPRSTPLTAQWPSQCHVSRFLIPGSHPHWATCHFAHTAPFLRRPLLPILQGPDRPRVVTSSRSYLAPHPGWMLPCICRNDGPFCTMLIHLEGRGHMVLFVTRKIPGTAY